MGQFCHSLGDCLTSIVLPEMLQCLPPLCHGELSPWMGWQGRAMGCWSFWVSFESSSCSLCTQGLSRSRLGWGCCYLSFLLWHSFPQVPSLPCSVLCWVEIGVQAIH